MKSKSGFGYLIAFAIIALLIAVPVIAATTSATITVNVNISSVGAIVVLPNSISWNTNGMGSLNPGSDSSIQSLIVKNTGSVNLSQIYLNTSTVGDESVNPLQTANASFYSAAGLIFIRNSSNTTYRHAGRIEWNLSTVLYNESLGTTGWNSLTAFSHGWYRNASGNEFLWKLVNGTNGFCNTTGTTFAIKINPENASAINRDLTTGTADTSSGCTFVQGSSGEKWGSVSCTTGPLAGSCIATPATCDKILIYKFYTSLADYPACANSAYLHKGTIVPGDEVGINVFASVPKGTPAGDTKQGTLTIIANY